MSGWFPVARGITADRAYAVLPGIEPLQRCLDLADFLLGRIADTLEHLIALTLDGKLLPVRRMLSVELIVDCDHALLQFGIARLQLGSALAVGNHGFHLKI